MTTDAAEVRTGIDAPSIVSVRATPAVLSSTSSARLTPVFQPVVVIANGELLSVPNRRTSSLACMSSVYVEPRFPATIGTATAAPAAIAVQLAALKLAPDVKSALARYSVPACTTRSLAL
jgi:hypothetical protein